MQKKNKANLALGISAAGLAGTIGIGGSGPVLELLHHGFLAATIGGLADWFAVTAIFHRPLGISYRTDILRRNRGRIMEALVNYASNDLLSVDNIMKVVDCQDTGQLLVDYLERRGGSARVKAIVQEIIMTAARHDSAIWAEQLAPLVRSSLEQADLGALLDQLADDLATGEGTRHILHGVLLWLQAVRRSPEFQQALLDKTDALLKEYEGESTGRAFMLSMLGLDGPGAVELINKRLEGQLKGLLEGSSEQYAGVKAYFESFLRAMVQDERFRALVADWQQKKLSELDIAGSIKNWIDANTSKPDSPWLKYLDSFIDERLQSFSDSATYKRRFDIFLKERLRAGLEHFHEVIPGLIRERLSEFSDDELVAFAEAKVQDDLQMIRINGSIVGALVGMALFGLTTLAERMWGL